MSDKQRQQVVEIARRFVAQRFPDASLVLLCGRWARGDAHIGTVGGVVSVKPCAAP